MPTASPPRGKTAPAPAVLQTAERTLQMLDLLAFEDVAGKGFGVSELARRFDIPRNTCHRVLRTLVACGYGMQNEDGRYAAGPKCRMLGQYSRLTCAPTSWASPTSSASHTPRSP